VYSPGNKRQKEKEMGDIKEVNTVWLYYEVQELRKRVDHLEEELRPIKYPSKHTVYLFTANYHHFHVLVPVRADIAGGKLSLSPMPPRQVGPTDEWKDIEEESILDLIYAYKNSSWMMGSDYVGADIMIDDPDIFTHRQDETETLTNKKRLLSQEKETLVLATSLDKKLYRNIWDQARMEIVKAKMLPWQRQEAKDGD
jgi:hypothetical protein